MIRKVLVPVPVVNGVGSVSVLSTIAASGFQYAYFNGKCIQVGLIPPTGTNPTGSFYVFDSTNFVPISANFTGAYNWSGVAGLVGDLTVNILSSVSSVHALVFIFDDDNI